MTQIRYSFIITFSRIEHRFSHDLLPAQNETPLRLEMSTILEKLKPKCLIVIILIFYKIIANEQRQCHLVFGVSATKNSCDCYIPLALNRSFYMNKKLCVLCC